MRQVKTKTTRYLAIMFAMFMLFVMTMPNAATVKLNKTKASIYKGDTVQLQVTGTTTAVKWSSSKKSVATVSSKGLVTGKKAGTATITAKVGSKKYKCKVTVKKPLPVISSTAATVQVGKTIKLTVSNASSVSWSSSDKSIATVSSKGVVTGKKAGSTTIKAKASGKTLKCTVTVTKDKVIPVERIELSLKEITHFIGESPSRTYKVTAKIYPDNATNKKIYWRNPSISTCDAFVKVPGSYTTGNTTVEVCVNNTGTGSIIAEAQDGSGVKATLKVTVRDKAQEAREQTEKELAEAKAKGPLAFIAYCEQHKYDTVSIWALTDYDYAKYDAYTARAYDGPTLHRPSSPHVRVSTEYYQAGNTIYQEWIKEILQKSRAIYFTEPAFQLRAITEYLYALYAKGTIGYGQRTNPWGLCPALGTLMNDPYNKYSSPKGNPVCGDCWAMAELLKDIGKYLGYTNSKRSNPNPNDGHTMAYICANGKWYMCDMMTNTFLRFENGKIIQDTTSTADSFNAAAKPIYEKYGEPDYDIGYTYP